MHIEDAVHPQTRAIRIVVGDLKLIVDVRDARWPVLQGSVESFGTIDGDVVGSIAERRRHEGQTVRHRTDKVRHAVVGEFVGHVFTPDRDVSVAMGASKGQFPGDLLDGNGHPVGAVGELS